MPNAKVKVIGATVLMEVEGQPFPKRFSDLHQLLKDVESKEITLSNPSQLPEYFLKKYNSFNHIQKS